MSFKIYFAGSIRGGRDDKETYLQLIQYLSKFGQVLTEHIGHKKLNQMGEEDKTEEYIFNRDVSWIKEADLIIAEVSTPSLGVGYEIALAESLNKEILCLYKKQVNKKLSAMINGNDYVKILIYDNIKNIKKQLDLFFKDKS